MCGIRRATCLYPEAGKGHPVSILDSGRNKKRNHMKSYTYTELDELTGEVLPERAVLSTLLAGGGHNGGGAVVSPQCQGVVAVNEGLAGVAGATNSSSMQCIGSTLAVGG